MDSSAMPALSVCCSPEGGPLTEPPHNVGNCLLQRDSADVGTECEINLAMISLICSEWHPPQVKGASASLSICSSDWVPSRPLVALASATLMAAVTLRHSPRCMGLHYSPFFFFPHPWAHNIQCSPKHLSRMRFSLNGSRDLFRPRRYRCNRYESHLEPGSENASRCFIKNQKILALIYQEGLQPN